MAKGQTVSRLILRIDNVRSLDNAIKSLSEVDVTISREYRQITQELAAEIEQFYVLPLLQDLRYYPPKVPRKINWTSEKQRRYVMALLRKIAKEEGREGDDISYRRTYNLRDSWHYEANVKMGKKGLVRVRVWNDAENPHARPQDDKHYAKYVVGKIGLGTSAKSMREYRKPMQQFHREGNWREAFPQVQEAYMRAEAYALDQFERRVVELITRPLPPP